MNKEEGGESAPARRVVEVHDLATTCRLKKIQAKADAEVRKVAVRAAQAEARLGLERMRLEMSSHEAASRHLARWAAFYLFASVLAFLGYLVVTDGGGDQTATVATLVTVVVTTIGGLLRSVVTESKDKTPENANHGK